MNPEQSAALRESFPPEQVGKLPKAGITLDYVGHGAVTSRLLEVDPEWTWEPLALDERGLPQFTVDNQGNPIAFWIRLTVAGVTRLGCGTCTSKQFDAEKVLIGDALRNAAMRFGVALDLWIKGHAEDDEARTAEVDRAPANPDDPCSLCGSTKAERVNVRGVWRCSAANDCKRRAAHREHPSDSPPAGKPATGANGAQDTPQASTGENSALSAPSGALPLPDERGSIVSRFQALEINEQMLVDELWRDSGLDQLPLESEDPRLHDALDQVEREKAKK